MPVTMEQVRNALIPEEPNYRQGALLGAEALPLLHELVEGSDPELATKAASLAGLIDDPGAVDVLHAAAGSEHAATRVAAARATKHLSATLIAPVLTRLVADDDAGVRKVAIGAVRSGATPELHSALEHVVNIDAHSPLRTLAQAALDRVRPN